MGFELFSRSLLLSLWATSWPPATALGGPFAPWLPVSAGGVALRMQPLFCSKQGVPCDQADGNHPACASRQAQTAGGTLIERAEVKLSKPLGHNCLQGKATVSHDFFSG